MEPTWPFYHPTSLRRKTGLAAQSVKCCHLVRRFATPDMEKDPENLMAADIGVSNKRQRPLQVVDEKVGEKQGIHPILFHPRLLMVLV